MVVGREEQTDSRKGFYLPASLRETIGTVFCCPLVQFFQQFRRRSTDLHAVIKLVRVREYSNMLASSAGAMLFDRHTPLLSGPSPSTDCKGTIFRTSSGGDGGRGCGAYAGDGRRQPTRW